MGANSSHDWQPPPQPQANISSGPPVDYHMVSREVTLTEVSECNWCERKVLMNMDCGELYAMLGEQFPKSYRMLYFTRRPGDLRMKWNGTINFSFIGFFRINPNLGEHLEAPVTWSLRVERSWLQSDVHSTGGFFSLNQRRTVHTSQLVDSIARNTQQGERLVAATETGQSEGMDSMQFSSGVSPHMAMDLFFEVPSPATRERYVYNIFLVPVHVEYPFSGNIYFPEIQCNWMANFQNNLSQGWRLVDIHIDTPMTEQFKVPIKQRNNFCRPSDTNALWIFERPASIASNPRPLYEGTIVEQTVAIQGTSLGVKSNPDWLPLIKDMGMRGWELSCVVESHKVDGGNISLATHIRSLLFFQRPVAGAFD